MLTALAALLASSLAIRNASSFASTDVTSTLHQRRQRLPPDSPTSKQYRHRASATARLSSLWLSSSATSTTADDSTTSLPTASHYDCSICQEQFASRNALFRHVRAVHDTDRVLAVKQSLVFHFGYIGVDYETAGKVLLDAFSYALSMIAAAAAAGTDINDHHTILGTTQTSHSRARTRALSQEDTCPSALDMLVVAFMAPPILWDEQMPEWMDAIANKLQETGVTLHGLRPQLPGDRPIHAEQSCSQHVYHFLLPVSWLPDSDNVAKSLDGASTDSTLPTLVQLKRILRSVESRRLIQQTEEDTAVTDNVSNGSEAALKSSSSINNYSMPSSRFGLLRHRAKRAWHNFADPALCGEASPNNQVVWRIIDRARIIGWVCGNAKCLEGDVGDASPEVFLLVEFRGDQFLKQQVRRIMGAVVAMTHGWLPDDYMERATNGQVSVETPLAPLGYLYRAGSRYHAVELYRKGRQLFEWDDVYRVNAMGDPIASMQQTLVGSMDRSCCDSWLEELRGAVAPHIRAQLQNTQLAPFTGTASLAPASEMYEPVLDMLQEIVAKNLWPATSAARSGVILGQLDAGTQAGSFTVVSSDFATNGNGDYPLPLGNRLFPKLAAAVFELEENLSAAAGITRPASSHCAINCNAQFTPHVDSGRGSGQSLSMIVALGDFVGGDLIVEGQPNDIRYKPLEFDGWKMRHWTRSFTGQRFSLVWFTPDVSVVR